MNFPRNSGFTILEIALGTVLLMILASSFFAIHKKRQKLIPVVQCDEKKWRWTQLVDDLEMKVRKWEVRGGPCLVAGFQPMVTHGSRTEIWEALSSRPLTQETQNGKDLYVSVGHEFIVGQDVLLCSDEKFVHGTIRRIEIGVKNSVLSVDFPQGEGGQNVLPRQGLVVAMKPFRYETSPSGKPPEQILFEKRSETDQRPLETGFEHFGVQWHMNDDRSKASAQVRMAAGECAVEENFAIFVTPLAETVGQWKLKGDDAVLDRWNTSPEQGG